MLIDIAAITASVVAVSLVCAAKFKNHEREPKSVEDIGKMESPLKAVYTEEVKFPLGKYGIPPLEVYTEEVVKLEKVVTIPLEVYTEEIK